MNINDLYDMTIIELNTMLEYKQKGLAYNLWKQAEIIARMVSKEPYENPEKACPELYPPKKTYKMPDFLKDKNKRKGEVKK
jgi:hypothetical protein